LQAKTEEEEEEEEERKRWKEWWKKVACRDFKRRQMMVKKIENPGRKSDSLESKIRQISSRIWRIFWVDFWIEKQAKKVLLLYQTQNLTSSLLLFFSLFYFTLLLRVKDKKKKKLFRCSLLFSLPFHKTKLLFLIISNVVVIVLTVQSRVCGLYSIPCTCMTCLPLSHPRTCCTNIYTNKTTAKSKT